MEMVLLTLLYSVSIVFIVVVFLRHHDKMRLEIYTAKMKLLKAQQARITDLENRLFSSNWQEYAMLQNQVRQPSDTFQPDYEGLTQEQIDSIQALSNQNLFQEREGFDDEERSIIG